MATEQQRVLAEQQSMVAEQRRMTSLIAELSRSYTSAHTSGTQDSVAETPAETPTPSAPRFSAPRVALPPGPQVIEINFNYL
jgi:hypothetical protein